MIPKNDIDYKILSIDGQTDLAMIHILFNDSKIEVYIPRVDGELIVGDALDEYMAGFIPLWDKDRFEQHKYIIPAVPTPEKMGVPGQPQPISNGLTLL